MIKTDKLKTTVQFGNKGQGVIAVSSGIGYVKLQTLKAIAPIGVGITDDDVNELPSVDLMFYDEKSIDVVILHLQQAKRLMTERLYLTC